MLLSKCKIYTPVLFGKVAQATLSSSLTLKAIKKEMKSMDGLPTFKVLLLSRDSESGMFPKKVKRGGEIIQILVKKIA